MMAEVNGMLRSSLAASMPLTLALVGCAAPETRAPEAAIGGTSGGTEMRTEYASSADGSAAPQAVEPTPTDGDVVRRPPGAARIKPENDPRYVLPTGQQRSLTIYLGSQTFEYVEDGNVFVSGQVSSGTADHPTPAGSFRVLSKDENKRSGSYTNALDENTPMPYSLQFTGPYFVHEGWVPGYADSHGCVRLHYEDARLVYNRIRVGDPIMVKRDGKARAANPFTDIFPVF